MKLHRCVILFCVALTTADLAAADPWADSVVLYDPGLAVGSGAYQADGGVQALGMPARDTGDGAFATQVGLFNSPYRVDQITSIGEGGQLVVRFDEPVTDDPHNPYGIDLLVFGNAFYTFDFADGTINGLFGEAGTIAVSQDNVAWFTLPAVTADGEFPTLGYSDTQFDPATFLNSSGTNSADFTLPVDPTLDVFGLTEAQANAAYAGSGGGAGVDLASVGLPWIQYVRILGSADGIEIDGFADVRAVPEPASCVVGLIGLGSLGYLRRRQ